MAVPTRPQLWFAYWWKYLAKDNEEERDNHSIVSLNEYFFIRRFKHFKANTVVSYRPWLDLLQVSLAEKTEEGKKRERLAILGMLINIHEQSSLASIFKNDGVVVNCFIET